jgi:hypothetical protein
VHLKQHPNVAVVAGQIISIDVTLIKLNCDCTRDSSLGRQRVQPDWDANQVLLQPAVAAAIAVVETQFDKL